MLYHRQGEERSLTVLSGYHTARHPFAIEVGMWGVGPHVCRVSIRIEALQPSFNV